MSKAGESLAQAGVSTLLLVHGTFVGHDALGILCEVGRVFPTLGATFREINKRLVDRAVGQTGNYTPALARELEVALSAGAPRPIRVQVFEWSGENNHVGRADGVMRLVQRLKDLDQPDGGRVLLWGHSHAGNVFALLTQLLACDADSVDALFAAARVYYRRPLALLVDLPVWRRARRMLARMRSQEFGRRLDIATFGTPIRYAWDERGYGRLMHFVNHRPVDGLPPHRAAFPPPLDRLLRGDGGDYVQQLGIAGTNFIPSLLAWRARRAEQRLSKLFEQDISGLGLTDRLRAGMRVAESGTTLLVDYGQPPGSIAEHHAGHAVYTRKEWLLFHVEEIVARFYGSAAC